MANEGGDYATVLGTLCLASGQHSWNVYINHVEDSNLFIGVCASFVCVCVHACAHVCVCVSACVHTRVCVWVWAWTRVCTSAWVDVCSIVHPSRTISWKLLRGKCDLYVCAPADA